VKVSAVGMKTEKEFEAQDPMNPSERIDELIAELKDWRGKTFAGIPQEHP
jgi:hypothetical protein